MKFLFLATVLVVLVAMVSAKKCRDQDECEDDECCLMQSFFRSKTCEKRAEKGDSCSHEDDHVQLFGKYYTVDCPCQQDLECEPEEEHDTIFGKILLNERCVDKSVTGEPETTNEVTTEEEVIEE